MAETETIGSSNAGVLKSVGWGVMALLALLVFSMAGRYLTLDPEVYFPKQRAVYLANTAGLLTHVVGSMLALAIGPFQFLPKIVTSRYLRLHRWLGRTYLMGVLFGGLGGLYMAFLAYGGFPAQLGFELLAVAWLFSGLMAYQRIRSREFQSHREWMVRNYALTFAAVTLRLWQVVFQLAEVEFAAAYITVAWLSWVPNLIVAEWIVNRIRLNSDRAATV
ncbi:MAG: DUF2306 domain-containing protein [Planctomycetes bacterium]|nr:DUF2306 domain-containing protein [Planctomycetota bacterium]